MFDGEQLNHCVVRAKIECFEVTDGTHAVVLSTLTRTTVSVCSEIRSIVGIELESVTGLWFPRSGDIGEQEKKREPNG